jgi:hypothetical protein
MLPAPLTTQKKNSLRPIEAHAMRVLRVPSIGFHADRANARDLGLLCVLEITKSTDAGYKAFMLSEHCLNVAQARTRDGIGSLTRK